MIILLKDNIVELITDGVAPTPYTNMLQCIPYGGGEVFLVNETKFDDIREVPETTIIPDDLAPHKYKYIHPDFVLNEDWVDPDTIIDLKQVEYTKADFMAKFFTAQEWYSFKTSTDPILNFAYDQFMAMGENLIDLRDSRIYDMIQYAGAVGLIEQNKAIEILDNIDRIEKSL